MLLSAVLNLFWRPDPLTFGQLRRASAALLENSQHTHIRHIHIPHEWLIIKVFHVSLSFCLLRSTRDSDADEEDDDRRVSRGCTLQYQRSLVKVLTQFHTTSTEGTDQVITMLGPDWQVDVTDLVQDSLKVADPRIAELVDRTILVGLELGSTVLKVNFKTSNNANLQSSQQRSRLPGLVVFNTVICV